MIITNLTNRRIILKFAVMESPIIIPAAHLKSLMPFLRKRALEIDEELQQLRCERDQLNYELKQYTYDSAKGYSPALTLFTRDKYILSTTKRAMTTREILEGIIAKEPGLDRRKTVRLLSAILGINANNG